MGWGSRAQDNLRRFEERQREAKAREDARTRAQVKALASQIHDEATLENVLAKVPADHRAASLAMMRPYLGFEVKDDECCRCHRPFEVGESKVSNGCVGFFCGACALAATLEQRDASEAASNVVG